MKNYNLFLILGNQLFDPSLYLEEYKECNFLLMEDFGLCNYHKHHKFKILLTLSAMRSYRDELLSKGYNVIYKGIEEKAFYQSYISKLKNIIYENKYKKLYVFEIEDKHFEKEINTLKKDIEISFLQSPMFLFSRKDLTNYFEKNRAFMANFYKFSRKKNNILVKDNKPLGGKWSFDDENRKKLPKIIEIPRTNSAKKTEHTKHLIPLINKIFKDNCGQLDNFWVPTNRKSALFFFDEFLKKKFDLFGDYEDALSKDNDFIFHSALSPLMNIGLLTPKEIIAKISSVQQKIRINSYEGFVRQIIGWREFIRGMYQLHSKNFTKSNYFGHQNSMTNSWYTGTTGIEPLDLCILKASKLGWNHHIERLMIIANIMNLSMIKPSEVYNWFMEMYVDSSDWVMVPNVYGMGLFSEGGIFATKPYICASSYILKMSNYKKGGWTDILDGLYWQFINKNKDKLKSNPRLSIMTKILENMKLERKNKIFQEASKFLENNTI